MYTDFEIVVARFNEDISWLNPLASHCVVYNKGSSLPDTRRFKETIVLPNVGREAHTYIYHMIGTFNKTNHPFITLFIQGNITDHIPIEYRFGREIQFLETLVLEARLYGQSLNAKAHMVGSMSAHEHLKLSDKWPQLHDTGMTFGTWYRKYVMNHHSNEELKDTDIMWYMGAIFAIQTSKIHKKTVLYYENLMKTTDSNVNTESAHFLERSWFQLFSGKT